MICYFLPVKRTGLIISWEIDGETVESVRLYLFIYLFLAPKSLQMVIAAIKLKNAYCLEGKL